ncbi:MAG: sel1 repeat family protein [Gammaproteobacteria bacterium]|nr:sel1 repeat family protein [Gammaproteobacteria bacterium]MDH5801910.1 sel1 repeat family protein [Gammaproteobacteria bacterium]
MKLHSVLVGVMLAGVAGMGVAKPNYNAGFLAAESRDYPEAVKNWEPLAKKGDAMAQFNMALLYHSGSGVPMDEKKAVEWYQKAAQGGHPLAQEYLAAGYEEGWFGLPKDKKKAAFWRKKLGE